MAVDILSQLITDAIARQVAANRAPLIYGVWIDGHGWLKLHNGVAFADTRIEVARTAATLWGADARILAIDERSPQNIAQESALEELADTFLIHRNERIKTRWHWLKR